VSTQLQTFYGILRAFRNNELRPSLALILAWIAICDDSPGEEKVQAFTGLANQWGLGPAISSILSIAKADCLRSIQLASEFLQRVSTEESASATIDICIALAVADNYLSMSENLILRYVARLICTDYHLAKRYKAVTGAALPTVGDPSSLIWWRERDGAKDGQRRSNSNPSQPRPINEERLRALFVLGLDESATEKEIHAAYRRLSQVHHPDKYHASGSEAVKAATETFKRINAAFELLTRN
jgi:DnaJ domain